MRVTLIDNGIYAIACSKNGMFKIACVLESSPMTTAECFAIWILYISVNQKSKCLYIPITLFEG